MTKPPATGATARPEAVSRHTCLKRPSLSRRKAKDSRKCSGHSQTPGRCNANVRAYAAVWRLNARLGMSVRHETTKAATWRKLSDSRIGRRQLETKMKKPAEANTAGVNI